LVENLKFDRTLILKGFHPGFLKSPHNIWCFDNAMAMMNRKHLIKELNLAVSENYVPTILFQWLHNLKKVTIGENVQVISDSAFSGCTKLEEVIFSIGLKKIGDSAFSSCMNLEMIGLPDSVEEIGKVLLPIVKK